MGPKKEGKSGEEAPKEVEAEPQPFELVGYGRFEYLSGVVYEGSWKAGRGGKVKHGYGRLLLPFDPQAAAAQEHYEGDWQDDRMEGFGSYYYPDGAVYSGEWAGGRHHGRGCLTFANGTRYEGLWKDHLMHGSGSYVDHLGRQWEGEFREGAFESRRQMELSKEKVLQERREEIKREIKAAMAAMLEVFEQPELSS